MRCPICQSDIRSSPFGCKFCGKEFCYRHQLPELHECDGLEKWKKQELDTVSKAGRKKLLYADLPAQGYNPKVLEIKNKKQAEQLSREYIADKNNVKEFLPDSITSEFSKEGIWVIRGSFKTSKILGLGSQIKTFEMTINAVNGKIIKSTMK